MVGDVFLEPAWEEGQLLPGETERPRGEVESELLGAEMRNQAPVAMEQPRQTTVGNSPGKRGIDSAMLMGGKARTPCFPVNPVMESPVASRALGWDLVERDGPGSLYPRPHTQDWMSHGPFLCPAPTQKA